MIEAPIRVGIAGLGKMGLVHAAIFNSLGGSQVVAVADPATWARTVLAELKKSVQVYPDAETMIDSADLDAVVIATPVAHHVPVALACVERGLPFFMEKPLARNAAQAEGLAQKLRERPVPHMVGYMTRFVDSFSKGRELLRPGLLGRLHRVTASIYVSQVFGRGQGWRYDRNVAGGGVLLTQGSHLLDLLTWYFGPVARLNAQVHAAYSREVEDFAHLVVEFRDGLKGWVDSSWSVRFHRTVVTTIEVLGDNGTVIVTDDAVRVYLDRPTGSLQAGWTAWTPADLYRSVEIDIGGPQYTREDAAFLEAVRTGRPGEIDLLQALHVQRIADAAYASSSAHGAPQEVTA